MKSMTTDQIRRSFLDFFVARGHTEVPSSPLVPQGDPTLLFTNSGMVQFKDLFTGHERRAYTRATTAQKCVRAGGKHNDLENVGFTPRHHTFFEMLGNFSFFGDYFKEEAIQFAWQYITEVLAIPKERLCVTVFEGEEGIPADDEAAAFWEAVGVPKARIFRLGKADNYWQMGDTGPQGPCSEIHYFQPEDMRDMFAPGRVEHSDGWVEIWNLVFNQFVRHEVDGPLELLPNPGVDTGAGLERFAMVLQGVDSTYETDNFKHLLRSIADAAKKPYTSSMSDDDVSCRVIADHARATAFLVADGVQPSNEARGYVLRRIMRRAIRHGKRLGFDDLFFHRVCQTVVEAMQGAYPELTQAASLIEKVATAEENAFRRTLDRGIRRLEDELRRSSDKALSPEFVAELYDTFGFPIDLTRIMASEQGREVDEGLAEEALKRRQHSDQEASLGSTRRVDDTWFKLRDAHGKTTFTGYTERAHDAVVLAIVKDGAEVESAVAGDTVGVLLDKTPLYGESGGQVGDQGLLSWEGGQMRVMHTEKPLPELIVHQGRLESGSLKRGQSLLAESDSLLRAETMRHHSATHLLHLALKEVLGSHVQQKGSLVAPDRLRFDYSHFEPLKPDEWVAVERRVNQMIQSNQATEVKVGSIDEAKASGATMLFGEKYGQEVRMVRIGGDSLELCGGTHVARSGDIGLFKLVSDSNLASGIRRIEGLAGMHALHFVQTEDRQLKAAAAVLKTQPQDLSERIEQLQKKTKELERQLEEARTRAALGGGSSDPLEQVETIGDLRVLFMRADGTPKKSLRPLSDQLRDKLKSGVVILTAVEAERAAILVAATPDLNKRIHAGKLVKTATEAMHGSGGGRPDFAQGGGEAALLDLGLKAVRQALV